MCVSVCIRNSLDSSMNKVHHGFWHFGIDQGKGNVLYWLFLLKLFMRSCWMLQTTGFHICKQKTIDNCTWNLSLKFIDVRIFCYLMPVFGKNMIYDPVLVTLWPRSGHNFERHHNNLSSVNYLMTTVKIERAFIHVRAHIHFTLKLKQKQSI
jgi:hypothetical protein